jgi:hypothetical protein
MLRAMAERLDYGSTPVNAGSEGDVTIVCSSKVKSER